MLYKLSKKQEETTRSLQKIERGKIFQSRRWGLSGADFITVCYAIRLRLIEFGDRPDILKQMAQRALADADDKTGGGGQGNED